MDRSTFLVKTYIIAVDRTAVSTCIYFRINIVKIKIRKGNIFVSPDD